MTHPFNPFDKNREAKKHDVAELLLSGETVSWEEITEEVGHFSPRSMGYVLRALEDKEITMLRLRDPELGTLYRYDKDTPFEPRYRLSKPDGPDAKRQRRQDSEQ